MVSDTTNFLKILIIEDDPADAKVMKTLLSKSSLSISRLELAGKLQDALELFGEDDFDIVLLDLNLPDSHGIETLVTVSASFPKTANIVLNFAFDKEVLPIDTHCHRIPNRLGWVNTKTAEKTEKELEKILPRKYWREFNGIFVLFGKTICVPISPKCSICPVNKYCKKIGVKKSR